MEEEVDEEVDDMKVKEVEEKVKVEVFMDV